MERNPVTDLLVEWEDSVETERLPPQLVTVAMRVMEITVLVTEVLLGAVKMELPVTAVPTVTAVARVVPVVLVPTVATVELVARVSCLVQIQ